MNKRYATIIIVILLILLGGFWIVIGFKYKPLPFKKVSTVVTKSDTTIVDNEDDWQGMNIKAIKEWVIKQSGYRIPDRLLNDYIGGVLQTKYPLLLIAIASVESNFDFFAVSHRGAKGPYQIKWNVWGKELKEHNIVENPRDLFDPIKSSKACEYIINKLYLRYNDLNIVLKKYVGGSRTYHHKVLSRLGELYIKAYYREKEDDNGIQ